MKLNLLLLALFFVIATGFAGCEDYSNPQSAMGELQKAVVNNDLSLLQDTLVGSAKKAYGNEQGLAVLRKETSGLSLALRDKHDVRYKNDGKYTYYWYHYDVIGTNSSGKSSQILAVTVFCVWDPGRPMRQRKYGVDQGIPESMDCRVAEMKY